MIRECESLILSLIFFFSSVCSNVKYLKIDLLVDIILFFIHFIGANMPYQKRAIYGCFHFERSRCDDVQEFLIRRHLMSLTNNNCQRK